MSALPRLHSLSSIPCLCILLGDDQRAEEGVGRFDATESSTGAATPAAKSSNVHSACIEIVYQLSVYIGCPAEGLGGEAGVTLSTEEGCGS